MWSYTYGKSTTPFNYLTASYDGSQPTLDKVGKLPHDAMANKGPGAADCEDVYGAINQAAGSAKVRQVKIKALETAVNTLSAVNGIVPTDDRRHRRQGRTRPARPHQNRRDRHQRRLDRMSASSSLFHPRTRHQAWERGSFSRFSEDLSMFPTICPRWLAHIT